MPHAIISNGLILIALAGCGPTAALERSCAGEAIPNCRPYEFAVVTSASLGPPRVLVADPTATVQVRVVLQTCGADVPGAHSVFIRALAQSTGGLADAGAVTRVFTLEELRDDGSRFGDTTAQDGLIDITMPSPFSSQVPEDTDLTLRFEPRLGTCVGELLEVPYRTGARWVPGAP